MGETKKFSMGPFCNLLLLFGGRILYLFMSHLLDLGWSSFNIYSIYMYLNKNKHVLNVKRNKRALLNSLIYEYGNKIY